MVGTEHRDDFQSLYLPVAVGNLTPELPEGLFKRCDSVVGGRLCLTEILIALHHQGCFGLDFFDALLKVGGHAFLNYFTKVAIYSRTVLIAEAKFSIAEQYLTVLSFSAPVFSPCTHQMAPLSVDYMRNSCIRD